MRLAGSVVTFLIVCAVTPTAAQTRVEKNVAYGMYSGLALEPHPQLPELLTEMVRWFDQHLKGRSRIAEFE